MHLEIMYWTRGLATPVTNGQLSPVARDIYHSTGLANRVQHFFAELQRQSKVFTKSQAVTLCPSLSIPNHLFLSGYVLISRSLTHSFTDWLTLSWDGNDLRRREVSASLYIKTKPKPNAKSCGFSSSSFFFFFTFFVSTASSNSVIPSSICKQKNSGVSKSIWMFDFENVFLHKFGYPPSSKWKWTRRDHLVSQCCQKKLLLCQLC